MLIGSYARFWHKALKHGKVSYERGAEVRIRNCAYDYGALRMAIFSKNIISHVGRSLKVNSADFRGTLQRQPATSAGAVYPDGIG